MIKNILKSSVFALTLLIANNQGYAQEINPSKSKISFDLLMGVHAPDLTLRTSNIDAIEGLIGTVPNIIPDAKSGLNIGLRGSYNVWNNVSAYAQFAYSDNNITELTNIQSIIDPFLGLLTIFGDASIIDPASIRVNLNQNGNYTLLSSSIGARYDYVLQDKYSLGVYGGLGFYSLTTPGVQADISADVSISDFGISTNIPLNNIIELDRYTESEIGWQAGVNLTYQINDKFYTGINIEYNYAEFDFSSVEAAINEESIPPILSSFLPIDLSAIENIPVPTEIDLSSMKYGIVFGMRL